MEKEEHLAGILSYELGFRKNMLLHVKPGLLKKQKRKLLSQGIAYESYNLIFF